MLTLYFLKNNLTYAYLNKNNYNTIGTTNTAWNYYWKYGSSQKSSRYIPYNKYLYSKNVTKLNNLLQTTQSDHRFTIFASRANSVVIRTDSNQHSVPSQDIAIGGMYSRGDFGMRPVIHLNGTSSFRRMYDRTWNILN